MSETTRETGDGIWALLELMGHRKIAGLVREVTIAGAGMLRVEVPRNGTTSTRYFSPSALYGMTPVTEDLARSMATVYAGSDAPVNRWELPAAPSSRLSEVVEEDVDDEVL